MSSDYIHERSLNALVAAARSIGITVDSGRLAPTRRWLESDALVPAAEHAAVVHAIFQDPRETLGMDLAAALPLESTGLWGFLLRSSADYGSMLRRAERYMRLVNRHQEFVLQDRGPLVALVSPHPDPSPYPRREQVVCVTLGHWISWGRQLTSHPLPVQEVRFRWSGPVDASPFEDFFGGPVSFGSDEDALLLDRRLCDLPLPESAPELVARFEEYAAAMIRQMKAQPDFVDSVRAAIEEGILRGKGRQSDIAQQLGITVRSLNRYLSTANTSFHQLRDHLLRARAERFLANDQIPIAEVSYLLGYAEPSTFHRAFRRWTGLTPNQFRGSTRVTPGM